MACSARNSAPPGAGRRRWIIDAIDGTASFLAGEPEWSTLIALEENGTAVLGLVTAPALRRRWWAARGSGAWTQATDPRRLRTRPACDHHWCEQPRRGGRRHLAPACALEPIQSGHRRPPCRRRTSHQSGSGLDRRHTLIRPDPQALHRHRDLPRRSAGRRWTTRCVPTARGRPWDIAALVPIIEEAGGTYTELADSPSTDTASALFTNPDLHQQIINIANHKF